MSIRLLPRHRALPLLAAGAASCFPAHASAAVIPFGTNLSDISANSDPSTTCDTGAYWYMLGDIPFPLTLGITQQGSCQFTSGGINGTTPFGLAAPVTGTATAARVKVGANTGRMRINVARSVWETADGADGPAWSEPYLQAYGPTFTPAANSVTTVPLNLPLRSQPITTAKNPAVDFLSLEMLSGDVPVPTAPSPGAPFYASFPGPTAVDFPAPSDVRLPNFGQTGVTVAMNADVTTPTPAPTPTPTPNPAGATSTPRPSVTPTPSLGANTATASTEPRVSLVTKTIRLTAGRAPIDLRCDNGDCTGQLTLLHRTARGLNAPTESLGTADVSAKVGTTTRVRVTLNARGKQLLVTKRVVQVRASIVLDGASAPTVLGFRLLR